MCMQYALAFSFIIWISNTSTVVSLETNSDILMQGGLFLASDKRFKKNINDFNNAKDIIRKLHPVKYEYRDDIFYKQQGSENPSNVKMGFTSGEQIGFLAQELQQYLPQAVRERSDGYLAVNYNQLFGVVIQGLKEQDSDITLQKNVIDSLINQNASLNNSINDLNKRLSALEQGVNNNQIKMNSIGSSKTGTKNNESFSNNSASNNTSYLQQNVPNPFKDNTTIEYYLTTNTQKASLLIFSMNGTLLKTIQINQFAKGTVQISGGELKPGMYFYSLIADDKEVDTKKMIILE